MSDLAYTQWEVRSGRRVRSTAGWPKGDYALVTAAPCARPCRCDGYEVGLSFVNVLENGTFDRDPVWPFLSAKTEAEARDLAAQLRTAGRGALKAAEKKGRGPSTKERLVAAAKDVATALGYTSRVANGSLYGPPESNAEVGERVEQFNEHVEHLNEHERKFYNTLKAAVGAEGQSHALFIVLITFENLSKERGQRKAAEAEVVEERRAAVAYLKQTGDARKQAYIAGCRIERGDHRTWSPK